jgi:hypothetical protein
LAKSFGWRAGSLNIRGETTVSFGPELHVALWLPEGDWARDKFAALLTGQLASPARHTHFPRVKARAVPVDHNHPTSRLSGNPARIFWKELVPAGDADALLGPDAR